MLDSRIWYEHEAEDGVCDDVGSLCTWVSIKIFIDKEYTNIKDQLKSSI